jgi:hypothetical protein
MAERFCGAGREDFLQTIERTQYGAVEEVSQDHRDRRAPTVVEGQEAGPQSETPRLFMSDPPFVYRSINA